MADLLLAIENIRKSSTPVLWQKLTEENKREVESNVRTAFRQQSEEFEANK